MKILYINSPECDYLQDLLFSGLIKLFGEDAVFEYPFNRRYRFINRKYPRNLGYNFSLYSFKRLFERVDQKFDLVIVGSSKPLCMESYYSLINKIPSSTPIIFVDGGDQSNLGGDLAYYKSQFTLDFIEKIRPFDLILKREFLLNETYPDHIIPFPFCFNLDRLPSIDLHKKYDVAFWAVESAQIRKDALDLLKNKFDCTENGTTRNQSFHKYKRKGSYYLQELSRCKINLNFRGGGWDTMRYWETPAVGSFMISQRPGIYIPNDFVHEENIIHCKDNLSDLIELCEYYLKNETRRELIAKNAKNHLAKYHTDLARAEYLFQELTKRKIISLSTKIKF